MTNGSNPSGPGRAITIATAISLGALNFLVGLFYALWSIADTWAINRAEQHGFDAGQLLPNDSILWAIANLTLATLVAVNILVIVTFTKLRPRQPKIVLDGLTTTFR